MKALNSVCTHRRSAKRGQAGLTLVELMVALTLGLYRVVGHWALAVPVGMGIAGSTFHILWCRRNGIDPLTAMPRRRYYELRGWRWRE